VAQTPGLVRCPGRRSNVITASRAVGCGTRSADIPWAVGALCPTPAWIYSVA